VSASVLYIFQLPAITRRRMGTSREDKDKRRDAENARGFAEKNVNHLSVRASTPGSLRPARNSRDAPPPVEIWEILSATPA